jgi:hypothetical protein
MAEAAGESSLDLAQQRTVVRSRICSLESRMLQHPQVQIEVQHLFSEGLYSRRMFVPKGVMWTGKIHRKGHICVLLSGEMTVVSGEMSERLIAPAVFTSRPGVKRAGFAHTDSIFMTVHATTETDLDKIEAELIAPDFTEFDNQRQSL